MCRIWLSSFYLPAVRSSVNGSLLGEFLQLVYFYQETRVHHNISPKFNNLYSKRVKGDLRKDEKVVPCGPDKQILRFLMLPCRTSRREAWDPGSLGWSWFPKPLESASQYCPAQKWPKTSLLSPEVMQSFQIFRFFLNKSPITQGYMSSCLLGQAGQANTQ